MNYKFILQSPFWFYILSLALAIGYAWLLYDKKSPWNRKINGTLAVLRAILVFLILFIVADPLLRQSNQEVEKPVVAILIDNSTSVAAHTQQLKGLIESVQSAHKNLSDDKEWVFYSLKNKVTADSLDRIPFNQNKTNLQQAIRNIEEELQGQNIAAMAVISDGNYNQGINPNFMDYKYPVYTVGLGDTASKKDLSIMGVQYNKTAYLGNKFIINYKLKNSGFVGEQVVVTLKEKNQQLHTKEFGIVKVRGEQSGSILLEAKNEGLLHLVLSCTKKEGEYSVANNDVHLYIEVVKNKDKILILASAPHPDVKALNAALSSGQNYDVEARFVGDGAAVNLVNTNAVVLVGIPNKKGVGTDVYNEIIKRGIPVLYILQSGSDLNRVARDSRIVDINLRAVEMDKAQAALNSRFESFGITELDKDLIGQFPPLNVPFASYTVGSNAEVLLYQKIGASATSHPLWVLGKSMDTRNALILGDGIWMWRMNEKSKTQSSLNFDEMVIKSVQFIASKADKRKFKVLPGNTEYEEGDLVSVTTEVYDELNQLTYGQEIQLIIKDENEKEYKYKYINQEHQDKFEVGQFAQGAYRYTATTVVAGKRHAYSGAFNVKKLQLEELTSVADHQLLKELSNKTQGQYYEKTQMDALWQQLNHLKAVGKVRLTESFTELINLKWLFVVLVVLISVEWLIRKYQGGY
ncbi:MAG TPA: hypothetical protein VL947_05235 [Cytophagales bacterium]|nr:hypothetical protein [Cytophagales bacterium]